MSIKDIVVEFASKKLSQKPLEINILKPSGSARQYYRCTNIDSSILIAHNLDREENFAFLSWANWLKKNGINVPKIEVSANPEFLFCEDLGDNVLYDYLIELKEENKFDEIEIWLQKVLLQLIKLQTSNYSDVDFFHPIQENNSEILKWDLNYFKYDFLKIIAQSFNELNLEKDFNLLSSHIAKSKIIGLQYRDFQSRNIMLKNNDVYFIDFQTIRVGSLLYDAVSLLYQSRLALPLELIEKLKLFYKIKLSERIQFTSEIFETEWMQQGLIRTMQNLGAYGLLGIVQNKNAFKNPIQSSINNLIYFSNNQHIKLDELNKITIQLAENIKLKEFMNKTSLEIKIQSFSYKKGLPQDNSEHGGGYIFDCRSIHNPGRYDEYKQKTGMDIEVQQFFEKETEMTDFLSQIFPLVSTHIDKYLERKFSYLSISFGCTGGQHRSVYSAEKLHDYLLKKYPNKLTLSVKHREQE